MSLHCKSIFPSPECVWCQPWSLADSHKARCAPDDGSSWGAPELRQWWAGSCPALPQWGALGHRCCCSELGCHHLWSARSGKGTVLDKAKKNKKDGDISLPTTTALSISWNDKGRFCTSACRRGQWIESWTKVLSVTWEHNNRLMNCYVCNNIGVLSICNTNK